MWAGSHQNKDTIFIIPQNVLEPGLLTHVEDKAPFLSYTPGVVVTFYLTEPFLCTLGAGNLARERT